MTDVIGEPTTVNRTLAPYLHFSETLPAEADPEQLLDGVLAVVAVEGPVVGSRLLSAYGRAAGRRMGPRISLALTKVIRSAARKGLLVQEDPLGRTAVPTRTYRLPDQPAVAPRELGARQFDQVPPAELAHVMSRAAAELGWANLDDVFRATMSAYGIRRMGNRVRANLQSVVGVANDRSVRAQEDTPPSGRELRPGEEIPLGGAQVTWRIRWSAGAVDLDPSVFLVSAANRVRSDEDFVFYNQPETPAGSVRLAGEVSEDAAPTERIEVDLDALTPDVARVLLGVSVDAGTLADVQDVVVTATGAEAVQLPIAGCAAAGLIFAEISRRNTGWWLRALHRPYPGGLEEIARVMGVDVAAG